MRIALIGNPNSGKTTLFNRLTGSNAKVSNWAGVTVEKKVGTFLYNDTEIEVVDLPGIYSLSQTSEDEVVAINYLLSNDYDLILNILDATNLVRNLYLTTQLQELSKPMIIAVNMMDSLISKGGSLDFETLQKRLNIPLTCISASKNQGIDILIDKIYNFNLKQNHSPTTVLRYSEIYELIETVSALLQKNNVSNPLFCAIKILDNDKQVFNNLNSSIDFSNIVSTHSKDFDIIITSSRYEYIEQALDGIYTPININMTETLSDKIDKIVMHKYLGIPLFLLTMFLMFSLTFSHLGVFFQTLTNNFINGTFTTLVSNFLISINASTFTTSLILDGIIAGLGMVTSFLIQVLIIFLFLTILEDIGYMSRATYLFDNFLKRIGLSGKAFIPLIMGFGCSVPAVMSTRTLDNKRDRIMTIIMTPFMSCSARLPVYIVFTGLFFKNYANIVVFLIYLLGILVAILSGLLLKNTVLKGEVSSYIMEIAPYRLPTFKSVSLSLLDKTNEFIARAFLILLPSSVIIWFLQTFDFTFTPVTNNIDSMLGHIGVLIAPLFIPLGFGTWEATVSLLSGFIAKEAVISTISILYKNSSTSILQNFSRASALSYIVFVSLYIPCIATVNTIYNEIKSLKWTIFSIIYQTSIAYIVSFVIYRLVLIL